MKQFIAIIAGLLIVSLSSPAFALSAESDHAPDRMVSSRGKIQYNYNIEQSERDGITVYQYDYVVIDPPATKQKILEALRKAKSAGEAFDASEVESEQAAVETRLAEISAMTYAQIDDHIESTFSGLSAGQKASLKILYKAVLALIKQLDLD